MATVASLIPSPFGYCCKSTRNYFSSKWRVFVFFQIPAVSWFPGGLIKRFLCNTPRGKCGRALSALISTEIRHTCLVKYAVQQGQICLWHLAHVKIRASPSRLCQPTLVQLESSNGRELSLTKAKVPGPARTPYFRDAASCSLDFLENERGC